MLTVLRRLLAFCRRNRLDDELAEEIRLHLDLRRQALVGEGLSPAEADRAARRRFGNVAAIRERARRLWGGSAIDALIADLRYGLRLIRKAPVFSAVAGLSLGVGIGASTVLFSVANALVLRPVHAANPEQLVRLFTSNAAGGLYSGSSYADYEAFRDAPVFAGLLASRRATATLSDAERPEVAAGLLVSGNYFEVLGLHPSRGRFFHPAEYATVGTHPVVVLAHDAWRRRFAADEGIVGRVIALNGHPFTVIGVGPPRFAGTGVEHAGDFFVPAVMQPVISPGPDVLRDRKARVFQVLGRLGPGVSLREADAALRVAAARLAQQDPEAWRDRAGRARVITVLPEIAARFAGGAPGAAAFIVSTVIAGVLGLVAMACVNVATVLLARATARRKEIAVRLAMGASRGRLVRQLLTECALLAAAGGALGLVLAQSAAALFLRFRPDGVPFLDLAIDYRILVFVLAVSLCAVVLSGLAPALQATRPDVQAELKDPVRGVRMRGLRFGLRAGLVVIQVAVSMALLTGAGLMLRSAAAGLTEHPGFRRQDVLSVGIDLSMVPDREGAHDRFYREAVAAVAALPAVERVALAGLVPMDGSNRQATFRIEDGASPATTSPDVNVVGAGYFALLDIPVRRGREFTRADTRTSPPVVVVNETMARRFWNGDALGRTLALEQTGDRLQVVGTVRDLRHRSFGEEPVPMVYFCAEQRYLPRMTLHVRAAAPSGVIGPAVQQVLRRIDRAAGLGRAETMTEYFERVTQPQRLGAAAAMATAALELALAAMALYGVIAFAASERKREIGLRVALGASRRSVVGLVMRDGLLMTAVGLVLGAGLALAGGAALRSVLIGVGPADPVSLAGAVMAILLVAAAASYVPARRALRIDPSTALRGE
jgi:predicted permease